MSDRHLRDPNRAMAQALEGLSRKVEVLRTRTLAGVARTAREIGVWWQPGALGSVSVRAPAGFWLCYIQGSFVAYGDAAGTRIGIGVGVAPVSTGIFTVGNNDWPLASEYISWTTANDAVGAPIPTERTLSAVGWIEMDEEFLVALTVGVYGNPTSPSWYNGRVILIPQ